MAIGIDADERWPGGNPRIDRVRVEYSAESGRERRWRGRSTRCRTLIPQFKDTSLAIRLSEGVVKDIDTGIDNRNDDSSAARGPLMISLGPRRFRRHFPRHLHLPHGPVQRDPENWLECNRHNAW